MFAIEIRTKSKEGNLYEKSLENTFYLFLYTCHFHHFPKAATCVYESKEYMRVNILKGKFKN